MNNFTEGFYKFFIPGRLPGLNDYTAANRYNRYAGAKMKKDTEEIVITCIKNDLKGLEIKKPIFMRYTWIEKNKRRDLDNICFARKFIQDSLVEVGVLENDGWKNIVGFEDCFKVDKDQPGVLVEMVEFDEKRS